MFDRESAKRNMRVDYDDEDELIEDLVQAATEYVTSVTGVINSPTVSMQYIRVCQLLVAHWFANREGVAEGNLKTVPYGIDMLIENLRPSLL